MGCDDYCFVPLCNHKRSRVKLSTQYPEKLGGYMNSGQHALKGITKMKQANSESGKQQITIVFVTAILRRGKNLQFYIVNVVSLKENSFCHQYFLTD
jgi:hypothetical protein